MTLTISNLNIFYLAYTNALSKIILGHQLRPMLQKKHQPR